MATDAVKMISRKTNFSNEDISAVQGLLEKGATIPFIARYRKEMTGSMDEIGIRQIRDLTEQYQALSTRRETIIKSLQERQLYSDDLAAKIENAQSLSALEDVYEKYRPKKKTRASMAKEKGLEGLALFLMAQTNEDPQVVAKKYVSSETGVESEDAALAGARDIIAETISDDADVRSGVRRLFHDSAVIVSKVKKSKQESGIKYKDYYDWSEPASKAPSHRMMAMFRGKKEQVLTIRILPDEETACALIQRRYLKNQNRAADHVKMAIQDAYKRLLSKSIETEYSGQLKEKADISAVRVFAENLKALLLSPPMGARRLLAIDPGFRTGCKAVCLDEQGSLLADTVIFPHSRDASSAKDIVLDLVEKYRIQAVAIGNGTAGRETQAFFRSIKFDTPMMTVMVDESGASIYSASESARKEFPDHDLTVRGAVSIGRRLMDPLAELVKLDPKSIGVGQYQHDVDQSMLQKTLDDVVVSCVNQVGVLVNMASSELLARVAGLNATTAANIVAFRDAHGPFKDRKTLLKVPRLGPKAFEQAAGFLRIETAANPLDNSGVHPESYGIVSAMAKDAGLTVANLIRNKTAVAAIDLEKYVTRNIGIPTLEDIRKELLNPARDPRDSFENTDFDDSVHEISDLVAGMQLNGIVTNVTAFGAFVDIGVHQDGLVHISQMADRFVKDPHEIASVKQQVKVTVLDVDVKRKRISLSMRQNPDIGK